MRKKHLFFLLPILIFVLAATSSPTIRVGIYHNPPLSLIENRQPRGFVVDILERIAEEEGWHIEYQQCEWEACLRALENGEIDLLGPIGYSDERSQRFDFSNETLLTNWGQIYAQSGATNLSILDLADKPIAMLRGDIHTTEFLSLVQDFDIAIEPLYFDDYDNVLTAVAEKQAYAGILNHIFAMQHASRYGIEETGIVFNPIEVRFATSKGANTALMRTLDEQLVALKNDTNSHYYQAMDIWLYTGHSSVAQTAPWMWWLLGGALCSVLIVLGINYYLRKQIQKRTRDAEESRAELALILDRIPEMISFLDSDLRYIYADEAYAGWYGFKKEEVVGKYVKDILPPKNYAKVHPRLLEVVETGKEIHYSHQIVRIDGTKADVSISYIPKKDAHGKVEAFFATVRDTTPEKEAERALVESEEKYRQLVDNALVGIFILQDNKIRFLNQGVLTLFGYSEFNELLGHPVSDLVAPQDEERVQEELNLALSGEGREGQYIFKALRKEGDTFDAEIVQQLIQYDGEPAAQVMLIDVSDRVRAEARFRRLSESSYEAIFISERGVCLEQNSTAEQIFGYTDKEAVGRMGTEWIAPEDRDLVLHHMLTGYEEPYRITALRKDGTTFPAEIRGRMMAYEGRKVRVTALRDISEQVEVETKLRESEKRYRKMVLSNEAVMLLLNPATGKIVEANDAASRFYGWTKEELQEKKISEINVLSDEEVYAEMQRAQDAQKNHFIFKHRLANKEIRDVEVYSTTITVGGDTLLHSIIHDITERTQASLALQDREQKLREAQKIGKMGHWEVDLQTGDLVWSEQVYRIFDVDPHEFDVSYEVFLERIHPDDREDVDERYRHSIDTKKPYDIEHRLLLENGDIRYVQERGRTEYDQHGNPLRFIGTIQDVTETVLAELVMNLRAELAEYSLTHSLQELLRKTLDEAEELTNSKIGFYHFVEGDQQHISLQQWSSRTVEEYCDVPDLARHYPVDQAGVWVECIETKAPTIHNDYAALENKKGMPEGHAVLVRELVVPVIRGGNVVAILGLGNKSTAYTQQDVTLVSQVADLCWEVSERKFTEEALSQSKFLLLETQRLARLGSYRFYIHSSIWTSNSVLDDIFGIDERYERSVAGWLALIHPEDRAMMQVYLQEEVLSGRSPFNKRYRIIRHDTEEARWVHGMGKLEHDSEGNLVSMVGTIQDITELTLAEKELEQSEQRLRTLINATPDIICFKDGEGRWLMANDADLELFELTDVDYVGKTDAELAAYSDFYHDAFLACEETDELAWQAGGLSRANEVIPRPNGDDKVYDVIKVPLFNEDGTREGLVVLGRDITQQVEYQHELKHHVRQLEIVNAISTALSTSLALDDLLKTILQQVVQVIECDSASIFLAEDEQKLRIVYAVGDAKDVMDHSFDLSETLMAKIDPKEKILIKDDVLDDPDYSVWDSSVTIRGWMGLSLYARGNLVGYLTFDSVQPAAFTADDASLAAAFAPQIAQALYNAQLHGRVIADANDLEKHVQERTEELQRFVDLTAGREIRMIELKGIIRELRRQLVRVGHVPNAGDDIDME